MTARTPRRTATPRRRRRVLTVVAVLVAVLLLAAPAAGTMGAVVVATRYMPVLDDARELRAGLEAMIDRVKGVGLDVDAATIDALDCDLATARARLDRLTAFAHDDPLVGMARRFPATATNVDAADGLLVAGDRLLDAADTAIGTARRFVALREAPPVEGESLLTRMLELVTTARADLGVAMAAVNDARSALEAIPDDALPQLVSVRDTIATQLDRYAPLLDSVLADTDRLPAILGWDAPKRYLVLAQNPAELRPTGGFIGTYAIVELDRGRITGMQFEDVGSIDPDGEYARFDPPKPLSEYLLKEGGWFFRDANWSPDFPTTARDAIRLYDNETGDREFDGVIGITTHTIDEVLEVIGPVEVPGFDATIAAGETTATVLANTRVPRKERENAKAFLFAFVDSVLDTLLASPPDRWPALVDLAGSLRERPLLLAWFSDPADQAAVVRFGLDGAVREDPGDYLYVVDANVGPTSKLNMWTDRSLDLAVTVDAAGSADHALRVTWTNRVESDEAAWYRRMGNIGGDTLGLFSRLLVPAGSELGEVSGTGLVPRSHPGVTEGEAGRAAIGTYLRVPPGETTLDRTWTSGAVVDADPASSDGEYHLVLQKQPGVPAEPLRVTIRLPAGAVITEASEGLAPDGDIAVLDTMFDRDIEITLRYRR